MPSILKYMTIQIVVVTLTASVLLCAAVVLQQSIRFIDLIVNRGLPLSDFGYLALLMTPRFLAVVMPIAVFGATLFTYMRMQSASELIVLRSAGMNSMTLARAGLVAAIFVTLLSMLFSMYLMPLTSQALRSYLFEARSALSGLLIKEGQFTVLRDDLTVYAREKARNGDLLGLLIHSTQPNGQKVTVMAERGALVSSPGGARLLLVNGNQQTTNEGEVHTVNFDEYTFDLVDENSDAETHWQEPRERFMSDLFFPEDTHANRFNRGSLLTEGHSRIVQPLQAITFTLIALYFLLKSPFSRRRQARPIVLAIGSMASILVLHLALVSAAAKTPALIGVMYLVTLGPALYCLIALIRPTRHPRTAPPHALEAG